jgi:hypothetical protein
MALYFDTGDEVRVKTTFSDSSGTATDPTAILFKFANPSGTTTTYTYGVDAELVRDATGVYYVDIDCNEAGAWRWRFYSTGTGQAADEGFFIVEPSQF